MSWFNVYARLNAPVFGLFNVLSDSIFFLRRRERALVLANRSLEGIHSGEDCFVFGNGPSLLSLSVAQIQELRSKRIFATNSFYKVEHLKILRPSYYFLMDNNYWTSEGAEFSAVVDHYVESPPVFITDYRAKGFPPSSVKSHFLYAKHYPFFSARCNLSGNLSAVMNVVSFAVLSAIYMGHSRIFLLGCDYDLFCKLRGNHAYDDSEEFTNLPTYNLAFYLKYYHLTTEFHYRIRELADRAGVKIVNLSEHSLLDAYPRGSVSDFL